MKALALVRLHLNPVFCHKTAPFRRFVRFRHREQLCAWPGIIIPEGELGAAGVPCGGVAVHENLRSGAQH